MSILDSLTSIAGTVKKTAISVFKEPRTIPKEARRYGKNGKSSPSSSSANQLTEYKNPRNANLVPQSAYDEIVWISMRAYQVRYQLTNVRAGLGQIDEMPYVWKFIAPNELLETIQHTWAEYDSLAGRVAEKTGEMSKGFEEITGLAKTGALQVGKLVTQGTGGKNVIQVVEGALGAIGANTSVVNYRKDSPLAYKESQRRQYDLTFNLVEEGSPFHDIIEPVRMLQKFSAPIMRNDLQGIGIPYVFRISTEPFNWLGIEYAACKTIQSTFKGPYMDGMPTSCELTVTFESLSPMFNTEFSIENRISVTQTPF
jgi:hypothetical protein